MYSRLEKKEPLRATSSKPVPKKPRFEDKNKIFEFVLLQLEECEDAFVLNDNMVVLCGFIETTSQASEKDIRHKLG